MIITNLQPDKGCASVVLVTDTHHDRDEMRTSIETGPYFYDTVENNLVCTSFPSLSCFGISLENSHHPRK